jgi:transposase
MHSSSFQPLPVNTARAAKSVFNIENLYLAIGDRLGSLFGDLNLYDLGAFGEKPACVLFVFAMVTLFQYAEDLSDRRAADAVRTRLDWKYALHLPLDYPGIDCSVLNEFRQCLWRDPVGQRVFRRMLRRLAAFGLLGNGDKRRADVIDVLTAIDTRSRVEEIVGAMNLALEALASNQPDWLRMTSLPHWYERYDRTPLTHYLSASREKQEALVQAIRADISYLLQAIEQADAPDLALLPEVQVLRWIQHQQFESRDRGPRILSGGEYDTNATGANPFDHKPGL